MGLVVQGLAMAYGEARVLSDVSLSVPSGESVGLVGPNGVGKSTTLRTISGLNRRLAGSIVLDDTAVPPNAQKVTRMGIAHVPEGRQLFPKLSVRENLRYACLAAGKHFSDAAANGLIDEYFPQLRSRYRTLAGHLSGGEQQMVAITRGLIVDPRVLMVDELSLGLSPKITDVVFAGLMAAARERRLAVLLVDEDLRRVRKACTRIYALTDGRTTDITGQTAEGDRRTYLG